MKNQAQILVQKKQLNWKKISVNVLAITTVVVAGSLATWGIVKHTKQSSEKTSQLIVQPLTYTKMNVEQYNDINQRFYHVNNKYIKLLATEELLFYLPTTSFKELEATILSHQELTPNLNALLKEKLLDTVGSNLRVWGLNKGFTFDSDLSSISVNELSEVSATEINFDFTLGYQNSDETFSLKGSFDDSENKTVPISEFNEDNVAAVFEKANEEFGGMGRNDINRNGYFVGLNFQGQKDEAQNWLSDQTIDLNEFNTQVWDYTLNSLKNFNLVQEDVFVDASELFNIDGWNPSKLYVKDRSQVKTDEQKNEVWLGKENDFGVHSIVSKVLVSWKNNEDISFEFTGSYLQNSQWGSY